MNNYKNSFLTILILSISLVMITSVIQTIELNNSDFFNPEPDQPETPPEVTLQNRELEEHQHDNHGQHPTITKPNLPEPTVPDQAPTHGVHIDIPEPSNTTPEQPTLEQPAPNIVMPTTIKESLTVLGLSLDGVYTVEAINKAFRKAALKWHPDKASPEMKNEAEQMMKAINTAKDILMKKLDMQPTISQSDFDPTPAKSPAPAKSPGIIERISNWMKIKFAKFFRGNKEILNDLINEATKANKLDSSEEQAVKDFMKKLTQKQRQQLLSEITKDQISALPSKIDAQQANKMFIENAKRFQRFLPDNEIIIPIENRNAKNIRATQSLEIINIQSSIPALEKLDPTEPQYKEDLESIAQKLKKDQNLKLQVSDIARNLELYLARRAADALRKTARPTEPEPSDNPLSQEPNPTPSSNAQVPLIMQHSTPEPEPIQPPLSSNPEPFESPKAQTPTISNPNNQEPAKAITTAPTPAYHDYDDEGYGGYRNMHSDNDDFNPYGGLTVSPDPDDYPPSPLSSKNEQPNDGNEQPNDGNEQPNDPYSEIMNLESEEPAPTTPTPTTNQQEMIDSIVKKTLMNGKPLSPFKQNIKDFVQNNITDLSDPAQIAKLKEAITNGLDMNDGNILSAKERNLLSRSGSAMNHIVDQVYNQVVELVDDGTWYGAKVLSKPIYLHDFDLMNQTERQDIMTAAQKTFDTAYQSEDTIDVATLHDLLSESSIRDLYDGETETWTTDPSEKIIEQIETIMQHNDPTQWRRYQGGLAKELATEIYDSVFKKQIDSTKTTIEQTESENQRQTEQEDYREHQRISAENEQKQQLADQKYLTKLDTFVLDNLSGSYDRIVHELENYRKLTHNTAPITNENIVEKFLQETQTTSGFNEESEDLNQKFIKDFVDDNANFLTWLHKNH